MCLRYDLRNREQPRFLCSKPSVETVEPYTRSSASPLALVVSYQPNKLAIHAATVLIMTFVVTTVCRLSSLAPRVPGVHVSLCVGWPQGSNGALTGPRQCSLSIQLSLLSCNRELCDADLARSCVNLKPLGRQRRRSVRRILDRERSAIAHV